jgi:hypothetical protein
VCARDHGSGLADLCLPYGATRLDFDDDSVVQVDQVDCRVSEECVSLQGTRPLSCRIRPGDELRRDRARGTSGRVVWNIEVLASRPAGSGELVPIDRLRPIRRALPAGVGMDQAGIDREALATDERRLDAAPDGRLEQLAQSGRAGHSKRSSSPGRFLRARAG